MKKIILASASPRREELLKVLGLKFEVDPSDFDEHMHCQLEAHEFACAISAEKAERVAKRHPDALIIAADTLIVLHNTLLGKPRDDAEARVMLEMLSGEAHLVITGFTIMDTSDGRTVSRSVETKVYMKKLTSNEIDAYIKSKEPQDKAGAYAIQGLGSVIVERIEGDFFNVIGLPLSALAEALKDFGLRVL
jgi:septum formation protein